MAPFLLDTNACIQVLNGTSEPLIRRLRAHDLEARGVPIGANDLLIAATA